ncbi:MAG: hypothetical protein RJA61_342 [Candidatus Parcubacteria bacterium]|jgi:uncharacterized protein YggE
MNETTNGFLSGGEKRNMIKWVAIFLFLISLFVAVKTLGALKEYKYIGGGIIPHNVITVSGEGEVFAVPDIAQFTFSVSEDKKTVKEAQDLVTKKVNIALEVLRKEYAVEDKDIKTLDYSVYPKYDYKNFPCTQFSCPPSEQNLIGYTVNQTLSIKVRDVADAGTILGSMGEVGVTNISGINFTVDDEDALQRDARKLAITDAREKAEALSRDLGVRLVRIVNFSESGNYPMYYSKFGVAEMSVANDGRGGAIAPELPVGENKIVSNVTVTYEIR